MSRLLSCFIISVVFCLTEGVNKGKKRKCLVTGCPFKTDEPDTFNSHLREAHGLIYSGDHNPQNTSGAGSVIDGLASTSQPQNTQVSID